MRSLTYTDAMEITSQKEADLFFKRLVDKMVKATTGLSRKTIASIQRSNLGYFAGYYDASTRRRIEKLFKCSHPIFGSIEKNGEPTAEQAFKLGFNRGKKLRRKDNAIPKRRSKS